MVRRYTVQPKLILSLVVVTSAIAFLLGYNISSNTGVEPGFFELAEAGGYGAGTDNKATEGLSEDLQEYYNELNK